MTTRPYIRWDFQGIDKADRAILWYNGVEDDLAAQGAVLAEGISVLLWEKDEDDDGQPALMIVDAVVDRFDPINQCWVARVQEDTLRYEAVRDPPWKV